MISTAEAMLRHSPGRAFVAVVGTTMAFFLSAAQIGILLGWCATATSVISRADADIWVISKHTVAFDYGTAMPKTRLQLLKSIPGVESADAMYMGWLFWQRNSGRRDVVELVGLDDSLAGGPLEMQEGSLDAVLLPDSVIVDELYLPNLGVRSLGDEVEIEGRKAILRGISKGVRTITAAPYVFASLETAVKYDARYRDDEVTYVLARCDGSTDPLTLRQRIEETIPGIEALTIQEFKLRTMRYWMLETGLGLTVVITAVLGLGVGSVIISQTLYAMTNDHRHHFATMLAIGFSRIQIVMIVVAQAIILGLAGILCGTGLLVLATRALSRTPILLFLTREMLVLNACLLLLCCFLASFSSVRAIFKIDPVSVFHN